MPVDLAGGVVAELIFASGCRRVVVTNEHGCELIVASVRKADVQLFVGRGL